MEPLFNLSEHIRQQLEEEWKGLKPLALTPVDFTAGIEAFTQFAIQSAREGPTASVVDVVRRESFFFRAFCERGYAFSQFERDVLIGIIKDNLAYMRMATPDPVQFVNSFIWIEEEELNRRFGSAIDMLSLVDCVACLQHLKKKYRKENNLKAGYYFLWVVKRYTGAPIELPAKEAFVKGAVEGVLHCFFETLTRVEHPARFVETFFTVCDQLLDVSSYSYLIEFSVRSVVDIPLAIWPNKHFMVETLLSTIKREGLVSLATQLKESRDPATCNLGRHLYTALEAPTLREAHPSLKALVQEFPALSSHYNIERYFNRPFEPFRYHPPLEKNLDGIITLPFNGMHSVFVYDNIIIGIYASSSYTKIPPYLLAYNREQQDLVWGIPISTTHSLPTPASCLFSRMGDSLLMRYEGDSHIRVIDAKTGTITDNIMLPTRPDTTCHQVYCAPDATCYVLLASPKRDTLLVGKIVDGTMKVAAEMQTPGIVYFTCFSTHVGFFRGFEKQLFLIGPTGAQRTFEGCYSAMAEGNALYIVEKNPEGGCLLTKRTLLADQEVASSIEKSIPVEVEEASIKAISQNGLCVLKAESGRIIFVDLETRSCNYSSHKLDDCDETIIHQASGELWAWNWNTQNLSTFTTQGKKIPLGVVKGDRQYTSLLYVDDKRQLYMRNRLGQICHGQKE